MEALFSRWYAFGPWLLVVLMLWRQFGWRRALPIALGGWLIAFAAEWSSTAGPGVPFGVYAYRSVGLVHDWRLLGVPLFDSLSFTWLAFCTYTLAGALGARGARRLLLGAIAMVAIDVVVDPVALRGTHWWLGSIYSYPTHAGVWYGVSALNYLGWLVVGLALQLWLGFWLGDRRVNSRLLVGVAGVLVAGVLVQSSAFAVALGIAPSALVALLLLAGLAIAARGTRSPAPEPGHPLVLIACALGSEARAVRRALGPGWVGRQAAAHVRWSRRNQPAVEIWETGLGQAAASTAARLAPRVAIVLVAGVSGACSTSWPLGAAGVGSRVLSEDGEWRVLDPVAHRQLIAVGAGRSAELGSYRCAVTGDSERASLAAQGVDLVEMETAAWLSARSSPEIGRLAVLRTVSDTPEAPLGGADDLVADGMAAASPTRLAKLLIARPGAVAQLLEIGKHQRLALAALGRAVAIAVPVLEQLAQSLPDKADGRVDERAPASAS
ncbi:MAG: carotenoid biosynthesis protein [Candidatus Dormibacteria bacterium]